MIQHPEDPIPSPFMHLLNNCASCNYDLVFIEVVEHEGEDFEYYRCPCGDTEELREIVTNDEGDDSLGVL